MTSRTTRSIATGAAALLIASGLAVGTEPLSPPRTPPRAPPPRP
ncbi:MAG: hypothetical protein U1C73_04670 [Dietzia sp.]|nr:hypothetical protein [Dietzia sp.]